MTVVNGWRICRGRGAAPPLGLAGLLGLGRTKAVPPAPAEAGLPIPGEVVRQPAYGVDQPAVTPRPRLEMRARLF